MMKVHGKNIVGACYKLNMIITSATDEVINIVSSIFYMRKSTVMINLISANQKLTLGISIDGIVNINASI